MDMKFPDAEPIACDDEAAWLAARQTFLGASETPTILGCGYAGQSPMAVWSAKVDGARGEREVPLKFRIGKRKEPLIRELFTEDTGLPCVAPSAMAYRSIRHPFLGASLDGESVDPEYGLCPVELKNVGSHARTEWESEPPLKYNIQAQSQMLVTGAKVCYLVGLIADEELIVRRILRDNDFLAAFIVPLRQFWDCVETKTLPPIDASEATARALSLAYPKDTGATIVLPSEAMEWVEEMEVAKSKVKEADAIVTAAQNKIKAAMADNSIGQLPDGRCVSWKSQNRKGYTVEPSTVRVLRITKGTSNGHSNSVI